MTWKVLEHPDEPGLLGLVVDGRTVAQAQSAGAAGYRVEGPDGIAFCGDRAAAEGYLTSLGGRLSPA